MKPKKITKHYKNPYDYVCGKARYKVVQEIELPQNHIKKNITLQKMLKDWNELNKIKR